MTTQNKNSNSGQISFQILVFGSVAVLFLAGFLIWLDTTTKSILRAADREQALAIAEAGIEYYRWHLAHAPQDYNDGLGATSTGPYAHNYYDKNGELLGQFILDITPPPVGSTVITIQSTGRLASDTSVEKIIKARMAIPSFSKFAVAANENIRFGQGTEIFGELHSNGGIRVDGLAHNLVTSALGSYDDPDHSGQNEFGVHTHVNIPPATGIDESFRALEAPPNPVMNRQDVFMAGRDFPVPAIDFVGITQTLSEIKTEASSSGYYFGPSGAGNYGYDVVLKTDDTFDLYRVTDIADPPNGCTNVSNQDGWGSWSVGTETLIGNYPIPENGLVFLEDDVWVKGQINSARVTIASGRFPDNPATRSSISINENLLYTNYDGQDTIALIAQKNINIGMYSNDVLRVDAALVAQNGRVGRYYYRPPSQTQQTNSRCAPYHIRQEITVYGMIASNKRYGFAYIDYSGQSTGYLIRNIIYDVNLLYSPPPSFPLTTDAYETISWEEVK